MIFKATVNNPYPWHMVSCNFIALKGAIKFCYKKYNKNGFYISGLGLFISLGELNKSPGDGTCVGEPPGDFCDVGCCFLTSLEFFISLLFDVIPHLSVNTHFYRECYGFECAFFTHGRFFYPTLLYFCDSDAGRNTPFRILLCACPHRVVPFG